MLNLTTYNDVFIYHLQKGETEEMVLQNLWNYIPALKTFRRLVNRTIDFFYGCFVDETGLIIEQLDSDKELMEQSRIIWYNKAKEVAYDDESRFTVERMFNPCF